MLNHLRSAAALAALLPITFLAAPAPRCQDTPATFDFLGNVNAVVRIWGDGRGPYIDGAGQVEALLRTCTANGDTTFNLLSSTSRTLYFDFSKAPYSNATHPRGRNRPEWPSLLTSTSASCYRITTSTNHRLCPGVFRPR